MYLDAVGLQMLRIQQMELIDFPLTGLPCRNAYCYTILQDALIYTAEVTALDELEFERGLDLRFWRLPKEKGCGRVWVSGGLIRWKLSEEVLSPLPSSTYSLCLTPSYAKLTASLWCACWASGFGHRQSSWGIAKGSVFLHEGNLLTIWPAWREKGRLPSHTGFYLLDL